MDSFCLALASAGVWEIAVVGTQQIIANALRMRFEPFLREMRLRVCVKSIRQFLPLLNVSNQYPFTSFVISTKSPSSFHPDRKPSPNVAHLAPGVVAPLSRWQPSSCLAQPCGLSCPPPCRAA